MNLRRHVRGDWIRHSFGGTPQELLSIASSGTIFQGRNKPKADAGISQGCEKSPPGCNTLQQERCAGIELSHCRTVRVCNKRGASVQLYNYMRMRAYMCIIVDDASG